MRTLRDAAADTPIRYGAEVVDFEIGDHGVRAICVDGHTRAGRRTDRRGRHPSTVRSKIAGAASPSRVRVRILACHSRFAHPRVGAGYTGHYWGEGQRFGLIDIGGGKVYWWGSKNLPVEQARSCRGGKTEILGAFDGWAPEVVEVIERTPDHTIVSVPAQDRPFLERWGTGPISLLGDAAHPMQTSLVTRRQLGGRGRLRAGGGDRTGIRCGRGPARYEDIRRDRARMLVKLAPAQPGGASAEPGRVCGAGSRGAMCADAVAERHTIRPMRFDLGWRCGTEVRRPAAGRTRYWIADQV